MSSDRRESTCGGDVQDDQVGRSVRAGHTHRRPTSCSSAAIVAMVAGNWLREGTAACKTEVLTESSIPAQSETCM